MTDGRNDLNRMGIFQEMGYVSIKDPYKAAATKEGDPKTSKLRQLLPGGLKGKSAHQDGYFNDKFGRVFDGEAYSDPIKTRRQGRIKEAQKNIGKPFLPSNGEKMATGLGNHYGTLGGPVPYFSASVKAKGAHVPDKKNMYTNPGKKGTGYGYLNVTMGQYQKHMPDPYGQNQLLDKKDLDKHRGKMKGGAFKLNMHPKAYFDEKPYTSDKPVPPPKKPPPPKPIAQPFRPSHPGKHLGGCKGGSFDPYPTHSNDLYGLKYKRPVHVVNKQGKTFMPNQGPKAYPVSSIVNQNVTKRINVTNYKTVRSVTVH